MHIRSMAPFLYNTAEKFGLLMFMLIVCSWGIAPPARFFSCSCSSVLMRPPGHIHTARRAYMARGALPAMRAAQAHIQPATWARSCRRRCRRCYLPPPPLMTVYASCPARPPPGRRCARRAPAARAAAARSGRRARCGDGRRHGHGRRRHGAYELMSLKATLMSAAALTMSGDELMSLQGAPLAAARKAYENTTTMRTSHDLP